MAEVFRLRNTALYHSGGDDGQNLGSSRSLARRTKPGRDSRSAEQPTAGRRQPPSFRIASAKGPDGNAGDHLSCLLRVTLLEPATASLFWRGAGSTVYDQPIILNERQAGADVGGRALQPRAATGCRCSQWTAMAIRLPVWPEQSFWGSTCALACARWPRANCKFLRGGTAAATSRSQSRRWSVRAWR